MPHCWAQLLIYLPFPCVLALTSLFIKDRIKSNMLFRRLSHAEKMMAVNRSPFEETWPRGYQTFFIIKLINSAEHEICPAHKC